MLLDNGSKKVGGVSKKKLGLLAALLALRSKLEPKRIKRLEMKVYITSCGAGGQRLGRPFFFKFNVNQRGEDLFLACAKKSTRPKSFGGSCRILVDGNFKKFLTLGFTNKDDIQVEEREIDFFLEVRKDEEGVPLFRVFSRNGFAYDGDHAPNLYEYTLGTFVVKPGRKLESTLYHLRENTVWFGWDSQGHKTKFKVTFSIVAREAP